MATASAWPPHARRSIGHAGVAGGELWMAAFSCVALNALELCQIAQIDRVLERAIALVAGRAVEPRHLAQVYGMPERAVLDRQIRRAGGLIQHRVANITI